MYAFICREIGIAIAIAVYGAGIKSREKAGTAGRAYRALAVGMCECDALGAKAVEVGCLDVFIAEGVDGVVALLICADPEDIGAF